LASLPSRIAHVLEPNILADGRANDRTVIVAIANAMEDGRSVRFVHVGGASREENIELPGATLRSSVIQLMGSGIKSVPFRKLLSSIGNVFELAASASFRLRLEPCPFSALIEGWDAPGKPRVVVTIL
jgi:hypothetical protein